MAYIFEYVDLYKLQYRPSKQEIKRHEAKLAQAKRILGDKYLLAKLISRKTKK